MSILMPQQLLCSALEVLINKALTLSLNGTDALNKLEQKTLTIQLSEIGFPLSFTVNANEIFVSTLTEPTDCCIDTSIKTLLQLQKEQQLTELIKQNKLDISGDIKVAKQFALVAETLDIDWQSELAKYIGDIATYKLAQAGKFISKKLGFASRQIQADASEWLVHEKRLVVTTSEVTSFNLHVTDISSQVEALAVKIEQLVNIHPKNQQG